MEIDDPHADDRDGVLAAAEAVRHRPPAADAPAAPDYPTSFGADFRPPEHTDKPLLAWFGDERARRVHFHPDPHVYEVAHRDGAEWRYYCYDTSVTTLVKQYCESFCARTTIGRMMRGKKAWPRLEYAVAPRRLADVPPGAPPPQAGALLLATTADGTATLAAAELAATTDVAAFEARARALAGADVVLWLADRAMTPEEIEAMWDVNREDAANRGTWLHLQLELWSNSLRCHVDAEVLRGLRFLCALRTFFPGLQAYATEKEVFTEAEEVVGSIDWIGAVPAAGDASDDSRIVIVDWKRSKKLRTELTSAWSKKMRRPLQHLHDCAGCTYALQLSTYAWIMEKRYGKTVVALALCCVHADSDMWTFVPYLRAEVEYLMHKRRETVGARLRLDFEDDPAAPLPRCALTGRVLYDGVVVRGGLLCNRKDAAARFPGEPITNAVAETECVRARLAQVQYAPSAAEAALRECKPWSALMPRDGLRVPPPVPR